MTSPCVPGISTCLGCETLRVGTGCGRARSHFCFSSRMYIPGLEDDPSIRTGGIRVRMGSLPYVPHHCGTIIFSSFSPSGEAFFSLLGCSSDCCIATLCLRSKMHFDDAGDSALAPVGRLLFSCNGADGSRQSTRRALRFFHVHCSRSAS